MLTLLAEISMVGQRVLRQQIDVQGAKVVSQTGLAVFRGILVTVIVRRREAYVQAIGGLELQTLHDINREVDACQSLEVLAPALRIGHHASGVVVGRRERVGLLHRGVA